MSEPIFVPSYWERRLAAGIDRERIHTAVWEIPLDAWKEMHEQHTAFISRHVLPTESVLDAACGWGRLISVMPTWWRGRYAGVDITPLMVQMAKLNYPDIDFRVIDLRAPLPAEESYDWAICVGLRDMVLQNAGGEAWDTIERHLQRACKKIMCLEIGGNNQVL